MSITFSVTRELAASPHEIFRAMTDLDHAGDGAFDLERRVLLVERDGALSLRREYQLPARDAMLPILRAVGNDDTDRQVAVILDLPLHGVTARIVNSDAAGGGPRIVILVGPEKGGAGPARIELLGHEARGAVVGSLLRPLVRSSRCQPRLPP